MRQPPEAVQLRRVQRRDRLLYRDNNTRWSNRAGWEDQRCVSCQADPKVMVIGDQKCEILMPKIRCFFRSSSAANIGYDWTTTVAQRVGASPTISVGRRAPRALRATGGTRP